MDDSPVAIGIDGCPGGWVAATADRLVVVERLADLPAALDVALERCVMAIDMPIGLPESARRGCDLAARTLLGARRNSVFLTASRAAITRARDQAEATAINRERQGYGVAAQAYQLFAKIHEVDALLADGSPWRDALYEAHPEVCFAVWQGGERPVAMRHAKKSGLGAYDRLSRIFERYGRDTFEALRTAHPRNALADDDIADAYACLFTAERIVAGQQQVLPAVPEHDARGLPMQIVY